MDISYTFTNGTVADADEVNTNFADVKYNVRFHYLSTDSNANILVHSASTWTRLAGTSTTRTIDGGATWVAAQTDHASCQYGLVCSASKEKAIAWTSDAVTVVISNDSGDVWTAASVSPGDIPICASWRAEALAVLGTRISSGARGIYFSSNNGANWTLCTSGPAVNVVAIDMVNATTGFAIDVAGNIWKTVNGAVDWADTTYNINAVDGDSNIATDILAISATEFVAWAFGGVVLGMVTTYYDGSGSPGTVFRFLPVVPKIPFKPIKLTNGNYIFICYDQTSDCYYLAKLGTKNATTGDIMKIDEVNIDFPGYKTTTYTYCTLASEYTTNKIMINNRYGYFLLDMSNE